MVQGEQALQEFRIKENKPLIKAQGCVNYACFIPVDRQRRWVALVT